MGIDRSVIEEIHRAFQGVLPYDLGKQVNGKPAYTEKKGKRCDCCGSDENVFGSVNFNFCTTCAPVMYSNYSYSTEGKTSIGRFGGTYTTFVIADNQCEIFSKINGLTGNANTKVGGMLERANGNMFNWLKKWILWDGGPFIIGNFYGHDTRFNFEWSFKDSLVVCGHNIPYSCKDPDTLNGKVASNGIKYPKYATGNGVDLTRMNTSLVKKFVSELPIDPFEWDMVVHYNAIRLSFNSEKKDKNHSLIKEHYDALDPAVREVVESPYIKRIMPLPCSPEHIGVKICL